MWIDDAFNRHDGDDSVNLTVSARPEAGYMLDELLAEFRKDDRYPSPDIARVFGGVDNDCLARHAALRRLYGQRVACSCMMFDTERYSKRYRDIVSVIRPGGTGLVKLASARFA